LSRLGLRSKLSFGNAVGVHQSGYLSSSVENLAAVRVATTWIGRSQEAPASAVFESLIRCGALAIPPGDSIGQNLAAVPASYAHKASLDMMFDFFAGGASAHGWVRA
jgi:hypothetical protein